MVAAVHYGMLLLPLADRLAAASTSMGANEPERQALETALTTWCTRTEPVVSTLESLARSTTVRPGVELHGTPLESRPWVDLAPLRLWASIVRCPSQAVALALWRFAKTWWIVREEDEATAHGGMLRVYLSLHGKQDRSEATARLARLAILLGGAIETPDTLDASSADGLRRATRRLRTLGLVALDAAQHLETMMLENDAEPLERLGAALSDRVTPHLARAVDGLSGEPIVRRALGSEPSTPTTEGASRVVDFRIDSIDEPCQRAAYLDLADAWARTRGAHVERLPREEWLALFDADGDPDGVLRFHVPSELGDAKVEAMHETLSALAGHG